MTSLRLDQLATVTGGRVAAPVAATQIQMQDMAAQNNALFRQSRLGSNRAANQTNRWACLAGEEMYCHMPQLPEE